MIDPRPDAIFLVDNPGFEPAKIDELAVSPKLGVIYDFSDNYSGYLQVARGFRAPPYDDVNFGFTNFQFGYTSIPNPDLKAETSTGLELGLRKTRGNFRYTLSGWINEYDDFIQSLAAVGVNDQGLLVFQSINVDEARIHGFEAQFSWQPEMAEQWYLFGSVNTQKGTDKTTDTPLNSIEPAQAILGINFAPNNN